MPAALFLSPHLDDVAFSCGGLLAQLGDGGWRTVMMTAFTATVLPATGFALACQLDKGLGPDVDYMALRREEDRNAAAILGVSELRWLGLPEAPHRGYGSAAALFGEISPEDEVWRPLATGLAALIAELGPDQILAPQGLGNHVDHLHVIRAVTEAAGGVPVAFYRDAPYAIRHAVPPDPADIVVPIGAALDRKLLAACAYVSQVGFQFGGPEAAASTLREFALREGGGSPAERFSGKLLAVAVRP